MSKILIIPDVHFRTFWKEAVERHLEEVDRIIFLGDYLDGYPDEGISREDGIRNFEEILDLKRNNPDKVVLLLGNHDSSYFFPAFTKCRFDRQNEERIRSLFEDDRDFFKLAHSEKIGDKTYLFSHAGLMPYWVSLHRDVLPDTSVDTINRLLTLDDCGRILDEISYYRGGYDVCGSIVWSDIRERFGKEAKFDINGYDFQVFGHTQLVDRPIIEPTFACLDCRKAFILDETGKFTEV